MQLRRGMATKEEEPTTTINLNHKEIDILVNLMQSLPPPPPQYLGVAESLIFKIVAAHNVLAAKASGEEPVQDGHARHH